VLSLLEKMNLFKYYEEINFPFSIFFIGNKFAQTTCSNGMNFLPCNKIDLWSTQLASDLVALLLQEATIAGVGQIHNGKEYA
jgi:hypothetical protein